MGRGIAMWPANAGIPVGLIGRTAAAAEQAQAAIAKLYAAQVSRGASQPGEAAQRQGLITAGRCDEGLGSRPRHRGDCRRPRGQGGQLFARLGRQCRPGAILASNTSFLDLEVPARAAGRAGRCRGPALFQPRPGDAAAGNGADGSDRAAGHATLLALGRRLGKIAVLVGAGEGFVANRMLSRRSREALFLLEEGALPEQVDRVLVEFGFPLGPFAVNDLGGLDVVLATRRARFAS